MRKRVCSKDVEKAFSSQFSVKQLGLVTHAVVLYSTYTVTRNKKEHYCTRRRQKLDKMEAYLHLKAFSLFARNTKHFK